MQKKAVTSARRAKAPGVVGRASKRTSGRTGMAATPVAIRCTGVSLDAPLEAYIRKRVGLKLGKFAQHITRVSVRFESVAGTRKVPTIACRIKSALPGETSVVVEWKDIDMRTAFDIVADAHERAVRRLLEKKARTAKPRSSVRRGR